MKTTIATISCLIMTFGLSLQNANGNQVLSSTAVVLGTDSYGENCDRASSKLGDQVRLDCKSRGEVVIDISVGECKYFGANTFISAKYMCSESSKYEQRVDRKKEAEVKRERDERARNERAESDAKIEAITKKLSVGDNVVVTLPAGVFEAKLLEILRDGTSLLQFPSDEVATYDTKLVTRKKIDIGDNAIICNRTSGFGINKMKATVVKIDGVNINYTLKTANNEDTIVLEDKLAYFYESHYVNKGKCN